MMVKWADRRDYLYTKNYLNMANLDPKRKMTHEVVALDFPEHGGYYAGSYEDCEEYIAESQDPFGTLRIVPIKTAKPKHESVLS